MPGNAIPGSELDLAAALDGLAAADAVQSNCMFQLAVMLARIALEPSPDSYREETAQALFGLIRDRPRSNVVNLFATSLPAERERRKGSAQR